MEDISNPVNLKQNFTMLLKEMDDLYDVKDIVESRGKLYREGDEGWLRNVENKKRQIEEIRSQLNEPNKLSLLPKNELNQKVIKNMKDVKKLIEVGKACPESIRAFLTEMEEVGQPRAFTRAVIMSITSNLNVSNIIRLGSFGKVYKGKFNGKQLSVNVLENKDVSREDIFMSVVTTLSNTAHRHLSKLYGYCFQHDIIALVYEYMENGSFAELLFQKPYTIEWDKCYDIAIKTGKAIAYLHDGCEDQIIHHDINASNILLNKDNSPKVADFGVAKLIKNGMSHITLTRTRGTPGYIAPEMWIPSSRITCAVDVYSFGIMLFEILARKVLVQKGQIWFPQYVWNKFECGQLDDILEDCGISEKDKNKATTLAMVALRCIHSVPKKRPSMSTVVQMLIEMEIPVKNTITCPFSKHFISSNSSSSR